MPEISCVVCHHTGTLLFKALESIFKSKDVTYEVIVITSDEELAMKGIKNCLVIHSTALPAEKRNMGARVAKGRYLAFFDDDVEIDELCLYHLLQGIKSGAGMSYGRLWNMEHRNRFDEAGSFLTWTGFLWSRAGQNEIDRGQYSADQYVLAGKSASCMVRADIFKRVGGFDEDFGILGEETDLAWRMWLSGYPVLYTPNATGYHAFNTKFKPVKKFYTSSRIHLNGCRNYITMLIKNLGGFRLCLILPIHLMIWTFAGLAMIITLRIQPGINIFWGLGESIKNLPRTWKKRKVIQATRIISDRRLFRSIYRNPGIGYYLQRFCRYIKIGLHG